MNQNLSILEQIVAFITSKLSPERIILFGSYARGDNTENSDIDILIIIKNCEHSPAIETFLEQTRITGKKIALFCCCADGKGKVFDKLKKSLSDNTFAGEIAFINPLKQDTGALASQIRLWVGEISSGE
jgi:predicted nucleotidyltransferase